MRDNADIAMGRLGKGVTGSAVRKDEKGLYALFDRLMKIEEIIRLIKNGRKMGGPLSFETLTFAAERSIEIGLEKTSVLKCGRRVPQDKGQRYFRFHDSGMQELHAFGQRHNATNFIAMGDGLKSETYCLFGFDSDARRIPQVDIGRMFDHVAISRRPLITSLFEASECFLYQFLHDKSLLKSTISGPHYTKVGGREKLF